MLTSIKEKINNTKLSLSPFPHLVIKSFLPVSKLRKLNQILPNYSAIDDDNVIFQSSSKTKKLLCQTQKYSKN